MKCVACLLQSDHRTSWYRVLIIRDNVSTVSELSIPAAHRLLPKLLDKWGVSDIDRAGLFAGSLVISAGGSAS